MSSLPALSDSETITPTNSVQDSLAPTPFRDDPYMLERQTYSLTALDIESEPLEAPSEAKEPKPYPLHQFHHTTLQIHLTTHPIPDILTTNSTPPLSPHRLPHTQISPTTAPPQAFFYRRAIRMAIHTNTKSEEPVDESTDSESEEAASEDQQ
nr:hypothetical protein [Tanacetum cinerariifolium]